MPRIRRRLGRYEDEYGIFPDYRGESWETTREDPQPFETIQSPSETARVLRTMHARGQGAWGRQASGPYRQRAQKYAQHAVMLLSNPTLPASERAALTQSLRQAGAPAYGGDAVARAAAFGPGAIGQRVGLVGSRGALSGLGNLIRRKLRYKAQMVSVWRPGRCEYDYYLVPKNVRLRLGPIPKGRPAFGEALETLLPTLPRASIRAGSGNRARGQIVADRGRGGSSLGALIAIGLDKAEGDPGSAIGRLNPISSRTMKAVGILVLAALVYKWWNESNK